MLTFLFQQIKQVENSFQLNQFVPHQTLFDFTPFSPEVDILETQSGLVTPPITQTPCNAGGMKFQMYHIYSLALTS